jgi:hypothetical protein
MITDEAIDLLLTLHVLTFQVERGICCLLCPLKARRGATKAAVTSKIMMPEPLNEAFSAKATQQNS